jgi:hypothetical protein
MPHTALILGAGFSRAAGLPLTRDLFEHDQLPTAREGKDLALIEEVGRAYQKWKRDNQEGHAEIWMASLYEAGVNSKDRFGTTWDNAIQFALRRLVKVENAHPAPWYHGICTYQAHPIHAHFWELVLRNFEIKTIVSLNYDILVEQALHKPDSEHNSVPDCYYGGFTFTQAVRKLKNVTTREADLIQLGNRFRLYKLHGSINWAWEPHSPTMKMHNDVRSIFRRIAKHKPAIIPPMPEKSLPEEFGHIWREARESLRDAAIWIVCGYSMPDYDTALIQFFRETIANAKIQKLFIVDPFSAQLRSKWKVPGTAFEIVCLPGLPEALDRDWLDSGKPYPITAKGQYDMFG